LIGYKTQLPIILHSHHASSLDVICGEMGSVSISGKQGNNIFGYREMDLILFENIKNSLYNPV